MKHETIFLKQSFIKKYKNKYLNFMQEYTIYKYTNMNMIFF